MMGDGGDGGDVDMKENLDWVLVEVKVDMK
ncbi:hypothetical protein A2U01_0086810, partial [Trifolium medium]|nr:hypothetical protein [Trifolium medium]